MATDRQTAIANYNAAVETARAELKDADSRPGAMTLKQERAQANVVNAFLSLPQDLQQTE